MGIKSSNNIVIKRNKISVPEITVIEKKHETKYMPMFFQRGETTEYIPYPQPDKFTKDLKNHPIQPRDLRPMFENLENTLYSLISSDDKMKKEYISKKFEMHATTGNMIQGNISVDIPFSYNGKDFVIMLKSKKYPGDAFISTKADQTMLEIDIRYINDRFIEKGEKPLKDFSRIQVNYRKEDLSDGVVKLLSANVFFGRKMKEQEEMMFYQLANGFLGWLQDTPPDERFETIFQRICL